MHLAVLSKIEHCIKQGDVVLIVYSLYVQFIMETTGQTSCKKSLSKPINMGLNFEHIDTRNTMVKTICNLDPRYISLNFES